MADQQTPRRKYRLKYRVGRATAVFVSELDHGLSLGIPAEPRLRHVHLTVEFGEPTAFPNHHLTLGGGPTAEHFPLPNPSIEAWGRKLQAQIVRRVRAYDPSSIVYIPRAALRERIAGLVVPMQEGREFNVDLRRLYGSAIRLDLFNPRRWEPIRLENVLSRGLIVGAKYERGRIYFISPLKEGEAARFTPRQWQKLQFDMYAEFIGLPKLLAFARVVARRKSPNGVTSIEIRRWVSHQRDKSELGRSGLTVGGLPQPNHGTGEIGTARE